MDRRKKFDQWKEALEARLALYLFNLPPEKDQKLLDSGKMVVEVKPHKYIKDAWSVWLDGVEKCMYFGSDAQVRATIAANNIINRNQDPPSQPTPS